MTNADIKADQLIEPGLSSASRNTGSCLKSLLLSCSGSGSLRCRFGLLTRSTAP